MEPAEVEEFLGRCAVMAVGAIDADGWPVASLAATTFDDGTITIRIAGDDPVAVAAAGPEPLCCTADEDPSYYEIRGVIVHGRPAPAADGLRMPVERAIGFDFGRLPH
ncbi:MAG TPA: hypothetical protein VHC18_12035 [Amycolatopsis sp.]|nr:hypothetical protein [Amycolatopsis sp.]